MTTTPLRILVVDDDPDARLLMRAALRKAGFEVVLASGGQDGLRQFRDSPCDLVMLDVDMFDIDGHEVCATLRTEAGPLLPIVMVTGMDDVQSVETAYRKGATDFIAKPVNWALFGHRVRYLLRTYQSLLELQEAQARIARLAYFDSLTGLPNRRSFFERVDREIARRQVDEGRFAILFMDLDGFKNINDTMGHAIGDTLLQQAADRLRDGLRPGDVVSRPVDSQWLDLEPIPRATIELARLGGDEFTALIAGIEHADHAQSVAQRISALMRQPFALEGRDVTVTTSIGIALYPDHGSDAATLLQHADTAMYHAKTTGRDTAQMYSAALTETILERVELEASLRVALERGEFHLVYQPQVHAATCRIHSVEALIRWQHPKRGLVSPADFIPLAEANGMIDAIGDWVLRTACADAARWNHAGLALGVAVNLAPRQIAVPGLPQKVADALMRSGLAPERLECEITEGALVDASASTRATLQALRGIGVRIALDDFGTGYSSMAYLTRLPINNIKIDRCFIRGLLEGAENEAIVRAVVAMAGSLGMQVTAEGVETDEQAGMLRTLACDSLQGFLFSRPLRADDIPALLKTWACHPPESPAVAGVFAPTTRH